MGWHCSMLCNKAMQRYALIIIIIIIINIVCSNCHETDQFSPKSSLYSCVFVKYSDLGHAFNRIMKIMSIG